MKTLNKWLKRHNEYALLVLALLLFFYSPRLFRLYDPTAAAYDIGVLQLDILAVIRFSAFMAIVWFTLKLNWCPIREYFEQKFADDFNNLTPCSKIIISLSVYFALFFALVIASRVI